MVRRRINVSSALAALSLVVLIGAPVAHASRSEATQEPIDAIWREHRVEFLFQSFNVHYSCSGLQSKLSSILKALGAHQDVVVDVNCPATGLVTSAHLLLTLKLPVPASEDNVRAATTYTAQQMLLARLQQIQLPSANDLPRFNAQMRTIMLTRVRRLDLDSGDCDLLQGVRDQLLPKLGISLTESGFRCYGSGTRTRPLFRVAALVPIEATPSTLDESRSAAVN